MSTIRKTSLRIRRRMRRRGFSLLELVVVIGIILILMSLVLAVSTIVIQQAENRQLETVFANLDASVSEHEQAIGRKITYAGMNDPANMNWDVPFNPMFLKVDPPYQEVSMEYPYNYQVDGGAYPCACGDPADTHGWERYIVRLLELLDRTDSAEEILSRIDSNMLVQVRKPSGQPLDDEDSRASIVDPWGSPLAVVFPGRNWREGDSEIRDTDGTIRTDLEEKIGICKDATPLFVSAGPDGDIGCMECVIGTTSVRFQATIDNVYSYVPENR